MTLPIEDVLPELRAALASQGVAVLQAPPGAGKTTRVPLALLSDIDGKIILLEPRRLATRAAAMRMAETLGEPVGQTVGFRMRGASEVSRATRIEVVTEGILTRMVQDDPELPGVGAVIFDEFHERSLNADLGLALTWEARQALRPDLRVLVMSATLDAEPVANLLDAPVVTSAGRAYPVERKWRDRPPPEGQRFEAQVAGLVRTALEDQGGDVLAFLPGEGEIHRCLPLLDGCGAEVRPLYGAMPFAEQRRAIEPGSGRRVVLATSIAETSLTIEGIRAVVDGGLARRARFDPTSGMSRLVTERVTRAEATQRAGRAGRVAAGVAYANWTRGQEGGMHAFPDPEIASADLSGLALELAAWGSDDLPFLTAPPDATLAEARALLTSLGALDGGRLTDHGRALARLPLHPRLGHMVLCGGRGSATLAGLLAARPTPGSVDLSDALRTPSAEARAEAKRLRRYEGGPDLSNAQRLALAYPDRIGLRRPGDAPRWLLSGGKGARMDKGDPLSGARLIVACDLDGDRTEARVRRALPISEAEVRAVHGARIAWVEVCTWSERHRRVETRRQERLGAIALDDRAWPEAPADAVALAALDGVRALGIGCLDWTKRARLLRMRIAAAGLRDVSDAGLERTAQAWLLPFLPGVRDAASLGRLDPTEALLAWLGWEDGQRLDRLAPPHYVTPLGRKVPIDYGHETPTISLRLQEILGETQHPMVGETPLRLELLSPAQRPVAITQDLPGFWAGSYGEVRRDMRAQYPRHPWPEDPTTAAPTVRAKPRGT
ncbi:DEAD/DEAH box helicase [Jannaschia pagri]|uniref:DEAD/DEAH box helicase n=1 Tax=Jannaschia pagri TaxID=2829797 RepID=A0ABQ4NKH4_9RHOB|nr:MULTISPECIES: ATP-dependent helicase HrpB [unclassified Jannaschia]GIT91014.1 DEAD/DEAH box helicase [Jannaschia sp. AI_61]GIT94846.1 DEAD/DEAH box helicase [Jannaschia sp. AI_62]